MVPVANERYTSLVFSTEISEFLDVPLLRYESNITGCSRKQHSNSRIEPTQTKLSLIKT
jgi:hypothetical protein